MAPFGLALGIPVNFTSGQVLFWHAVHRRRSGGRQCRGPARRAAPTKAGQEDVQETIQQFEKGDPGMQAWFREAYGYAVFPSVGKGGIGIGGARGKGLVYEQGKLIGKTTLTAVTIGFQLGGQAFSEVIFFKDKTSLDDFTRGNFEFDAGVSAVALTAGASRDLAYNKGVAVVTATKGGLMYEASVGGQKFDFEKVEK
jgi:lipid-binding SYLF domain-containing protein